MSRSKLILLACGLALAFTAFSVSATDVWSFADGEVTGCAIGSSETYENENRDMFLATIRLADELGQRFYMFGVDEGYRTCRFGAIGAGSDDETGGGSGPGNGGPGPGDGGPEDDDP